MKKQETQMSMYRNQESVRRLYEDGLNKMDWEKLRLSISDEYIGPRGEKGYAGFEQTLKPLIQGFPDIRWTIEDLLEEGDKVVVRWSWQGTHTGTFLTFPPSGKSVRNEAIAIYRFRDGRIVEAVMQSDRLGFLQQIGVVARDVIPTGPAPGLGFKDGSSRAIGK
jgi:steroid delta-isomerase-like uncharacterized protein